VNSRQRVQAVFSYEIPDRTPLGFFAIDSDTAAKVLGRDTYWRAKAKCQIAFWEGRRDEVVQSWVADAIELYTKVDIVDIVNVGCMVAGIAPPRDYEPDPPKKIENGVWKDREGRVFKYSPVTKDITLVEDPGRWTREFSFDTEGWDGTINPPDESVFEAVDAITAHFKNDRFVLGPSGEEMAWLMLGGWERGLMEVALRPEEVKKIYMSHVERAEALDPYFLRAGQHGVLWGQDLAHTHAPMMSPKAYRELFFEGFRRRVQRMKQEGQVVIKHACGNNWPLLDMFAEAGIDCYQSVQGSAGMDIIEVHKKYSDKFALWGGVLLENLVSGSVEDVRKDVDRVMGTIAPQHRFILGTSHSVAVGTKYDNFMALLDQFNRWI